MNDNNMNVQNPENAAPKASNAKTDNMSPPPPTKSAKPFTAVSANI